MQEPPDLGGGGSTEPGEGGSLARLPPPSREGSSLVPAGRGFLRGLFRGLNKEGQVGLGMQRAGVRRWPAPDCCAAVALAPALLDGPFVEAAKRTCGHRFPVQQTKASVLPGGELGPFQTHCSLPAALEFLDCVLPLWTLRSPNPVSCKAPSNLCPPAPCCLSDAAQPPLVRGPLAPCTSRGPQAHWSQVVLLAAWPQVPLSHSRARML